MDNSVFCSGCSIVVLVTEHVFLFIIKDLRACSDVPVILGVWAGKRDFWGKLGRLGKCKKSLAQPYPIFSPEQNNLLYILYFLNKKRKKLGFMRLFSHTLLFWQHQKSRNKPRQNAGFQPIFVPAARTTILSKPLVLYVNLWYNYRVVEQSDTTHSYLSLYQRKGQ